MCCVLSRHEQSYLSTISYCLYLFTVFIFLLFSPPTLYVLPSKQMIRQVTHCIPPAFNVLWLTNCSSHLSSYYVSQKFQLLPFDSKHKHSFFIFLKTSLHILSMAFSTSFQRTTSLLLQIFSSSAKKLPSIYYYIELILYSS